MDNVIALVQRLTARTRRRRIIRAATGSALGLSCAGLAAVRLQQAGLDAVRLMLLIAALGALIAAWQWWSLRRDHPAFGAIADLDRSLGLHARLLTAVAFADAPEPPALYGQLLKDTAAAMPDVQRRLPPVLDRPGAALAVAVLLLLLWPRANAPTQLAMVPPMTPPELPPVMPPEPPPQPQQDQQSNQSQNQQPHQHQSGGQNQQSQGGGSQDQQQKQQPQSGQSGDQTTESQGNQQNNTSSASAQQPPSSGGQESQQPSGQQPKSGQSPQQAQAGKDGKSGAEQASSHTKDATKQGQGGDQGQANSAPLAAKGKKGDASKAGGNAGALSEAAQQQALKADIQQLLKELSSELKQMQADMDAKQPNAKEEPSPLAGGSTDPELYDKPAALDKASGSRLPIQLEVDTQPTASPRKGSGTSDASKHAAESLPQQEPESASLSDVRTTEQGQARHAIPPDYEPVFERLSPTNSHHEPAPGA